MEKKSESKTVLLAGKLMPSCEKLADALSLSGRYVAAAGEDSGLENLNPFEKKTIAEKKAAVQMHEEELERQSQSGICTIGWNASSPVSSRTLILDAERIYSGVDEAVLYFDEDFFASQSQMLEVSEISRGLDELVAGYQYLTLELLSRFEKKHSAENPALLVFLLKEGPCASDAVHSPSIKNGITAIASPVVASAAAAFAAFAENIAALYGDMSFVNIVLVRGDNSMETAKSDENLGKWLSEYMSGIEEAKKVLNAKKSVSWIKAGSKVQGGFFLWK